MAISHKLRSVSQAAIPQSIKKFNLVLAIAIALLIIQTHTPVQAQAVEILPQTTDSAINVEQTAHYVLFANSAAPKNQLFLFLSGSYGKPRGQQLILERASKLGYHAIGLSYPNSWTVGELCNNSPDANCYEQVRLETIQGGDYSDKVEINRPNSIENRLVKLLVYLNQQYPEQGWSQYLTGDSPKWENIVVAGHSQGGGHAAMIAKENQVARVILLAAPADYSQVLNAPAPWLSAPPATPPERYYGFVHRQDKGFENIQQAWQLLGLVGPGVNVDQVAPPYNQSHWLLTGVPPARPGKHHGSVAVDNNTPKSPDGTPLFAPVWQYLLE